MNFEFESLGAPGDDVTIERTPTLGTSSVWVDYFTRTDNQLSFSGYEQRVCARTDGEEGMELPDDVQSALELFTEE